MMDNVSLSRLGPAVLVHMNQAKRPYFTPKLLADLDEAAAIIGAQVRADVDKPDRVRFQILASDASVFSYGGDLQYFTDCIMTTDRGALLKYAHACVRMLRYGMGHYGVPFTTIALVQGDALGGGFECALANNVIISEQQAKFGFPECRFGMFPGMGALSILSRKLGPVEARRIVRSGRTYSALEMYDMGVVDILAPTGEGARSAFEFVGGNGSQYVDMAMEIINPIPRRELEQIVELWVDCAMKTSPENLGLMLRLAKAQQNKHKGD